MGQHNFRVEIMCDLLRDFDCQNIFLTVIWGLVYSKFDKLIASILLVNVFYVSAKLSIRVDSDFCCSVVAVEINSVTEMALNSNFAQERQFKC